MCARLRGGGGSSGESSDPSSDAEKSTREQRQEGARAKVTQQAKAQARKRAFGRDGPEIRQRGPTSGASSDQQSQPDSQQGQQAATSTDSLHSGQVDASDSTSGSGGSSAESQPEPESGSSEPSGQTDQQAEADQQSAGGGPRRRQDGRFKPETEPERDQTGQFQSADGPRPRQSSPSQPEPSETVGTDGPGGRAPTERELFGGRDQPPRERGVNKDDQDAGEEVAEPITDDGDRLDAPGGVDKGGAPATTGSESGTGSESDEDYTGLEDTGSREKYHLGLEHGGEEDLTGLEEQDTAQMTGDVQQSVSELDQQVQQNHPGLDTSDYAIRKDEDRVYVEYDDTAVAQTIAQSITEENENVTRGDFAVQKTDDGGYEVKWGDHIGETEAVNQLKQNVHKQYPTITSEDYAIREAEDGSGYTVDIDASFQKHAAADRVQRQNSNLDRGEDFEVVDTGDGAFQIELTEEGRKEQYRQQVAGQTPGLDAEDIVVEERNPDPENLRPEELKQYAENPYKVEYSDDYLREQASQQVAQKYPEADRDDYSVEVSDGSVSVSFSDEFQRQQVAQKGEQPERFGDSEVVVPGTGGESIEDYVGWASSGISSTTKKTSDYLFEEGVASDSIGEDVLRAAGQDEAATAYEQNLRSFGKGLFEGGAALVNVPGAARGLDEGVEYVGWVGSETVQGRGGKAADKSWQATKGAAIKASDYALTNPSKLTGLAAGSLAGSYTLMTGASKVSSRAGTVARWSIQPGEELVSAGLTRGLSKVPGGSRVVSKFPGGRIDNEEIVVAGAKKAATPAVRAARRAKYDLKQKATPEVRRFLADESGQADLTGLGRSRGRADQGGGRRDPEDVSDAPTYQDYETELREEELGQTQRMLEEQAEAELDAQREQFADVNSQATEASVSRSQFEKALTMDPEDVVKSRRAETSDSGGTPYRGGRTSRKDAGMDWSVRQVELEGETESGFETATESEITSEVQGQPGSFGRAELNFEGVMEDAQTSLMEEAAQKQAQRQQAWEQAQGQSVSMNTAWDSQSDFLGDLGTAFDLEAETKVALEQEFETQQESNIEQEWEQEFEQELEYEYEKESELFGKNQNNQRQQNLLTAFGSFSKRYKNPIASAEEVLGWK